MTSPWRWQEFASLLVWCNSWRIRVTVTLMPCTFRSTALSTSTPVQPWAWFGGSETNLRLGLETLLGVLNASSRQGLNAELTRYTLSLMVLERKLSAAKGALNTLGDRIAGLQRQLDHFDLQSETLLSAMAGIYVDVISPLGPRIQVTGSPAVLQSPQVQAKVRASLLAGIRAAVLWHQVGGGRLQLMFSRNRLTTQAKQILAHC